MGFPVVLSYDVRPAFLIHWIRWVRAMMQILGVALLGWVLWDLFTGRVWLHRAYDRSAEPFGYWAGMGLWSLVAASCFWA